jgi:peptide-methionine (S)-S-oxide reductase
MTKKWQGVLFALALVLTVGAIAWSARMSTARGELAQRVARRTSAPAGAAPADAQEATFAAGCFWSIEAMFSQLKGVYSVYPGYCGGTLANPAYEQVCEGTTGHAESVQIIFDPAVISYADLLQVFWNAHDPTTLNRQGHDVGSQYRSAIFYHTPEQRELAEKSKRELDASSQLGAPIVTQIVPYVEFFPAESYHQHYYVDHPNQPYCAFVIEPKLETFESKFAAKLRR